MGNVFEYEKYRILKKVYRRLILNDKVVNFLYNELTKDNNTKYVYYSENNGKHYEISKPLIKSIIDKGLMDKECFRILEEYPEYDDCPYKVSHPSPYDHRWPGDYDEDAYDDYEILTYSLSDFLYGTNYRDYRHALYIQKQNLFDWEDVERVESDY